jgi:threonyl-tRNA synthetase
VLTVSDKSEAYGRSVLAELRGKGIRAEGDFGADKLGAKIRNARVLRHPYMLVVGPKDAEAGTVSVRSREADLGAMPRADFIARVLGESVPPT